MKFTAPFRDPDPLRKQINLLYQMDEQQCVRRLLDDLKISPKENKRIARSAANSVRVIREENENHGGLDAFLQEFKLSSQEGVALMCLAEALLRVPDSQTADQLIQDKLSKGNWASHLGESESFFVNASTWGLMLTGKVISMDKAVVADAGGFFGRFIARSGEPIIRAAVRQAMKIMGKQFVLAETIENGLREAAQKESKGYSYSYDMLGEAAATYEDARRYFRAYRHAINMIGGHARGGDPRGNPGISVKLSALHPRYEFFKESSVNDELYPRIRMLCEQAAAGNIGLTIDAEESERLHPSLSILKRLYNEPSLKSWHGLGFAVQAYQKRAPAVIDWIKDMSDRAERKIMIRLVKGAYWDSEIKKAQVEGYSGYPVFTRKIATDVSYLVCAQKLLKFPDCFHPLFATHNAHTVASILEFAGSRRDFEFQCLHGMGEILYDHITASFNVRCRIYAPVGPHKELLAYLVRRLLENGANSSFVNRLVDKNLPVEKIIADPVKALDELKHKPHPNIPLPRDIFPRRSSSEGMNTFSFEELDAYFQKAKTYLDSRWKAAPILADRSPQNDRSSISQSVVSPCDGREVGQVLNARPGQTAKAVEAAGSFSDTWNNTGGKKRAEILRKCADEFQANRDELLSLCILEAGKTIRDANAELREAVDFLRYYADRAEEEFEGLHTLVGPTGELNQWSLNGRGVFVCISPWNFPLAIFTGQVSAALAAGNCVLAKPAEQTPLIAYRAVQILLHCGIPRHALQLLPGDGAIGEKLAAHPDINGVAFTGSTETAKIIQRTLAGKPGAISPLIAETGGLNAMIADSTALPEQVVKDVLQSAFQSAGQRCSALRVLYLQDDIADGMIAMLVGAMQALKTGHPAEVDTDVGPIIDLPARQALERHLEKCGQSGHAIHRSPGPDTDAQGYYFSPALIEINSIAELEREIFGPILHVCRYASKDMDAVVEDINNTGFGLTFGIHSRIESTIAHVSKRIKAGNIYVNRNTIGAVVGVQPFGGEGLSGTGPKAGGPHYLHRFAVERSLSTDTTASGGNTSLLSLDYL